MRKGFVWSVSVDEGMLVRFGPDGKLDRVVGLPDESETSLSFGGDGLDVALVTSMARAVKGVKPKEREAGALFAVRGLGVRGLPPREDDPLTKRMGGVMRIEVLIDVKTVLGEGPLWDVDEQRLYFIDSFGCNVFRCTADGREVRAWDVPDKIGSMALRRQGGAVLSLANGFHFLDLKSGECQLIVDPEPDKPANRINDGKVDKRGRFVAGSMDTMEEGPNGALYRLDPDLSLHNLDDRIIVSNGPCWSPDGRVFYFADSWSGEIWAYDYDLDTGDVSNKRTFCKIDRSRGGAADGSTVDAEGCLWNAQVYDGKVIRYAPDGKVDRVIDMPVKKVTSVMFGGPKLDVLYVTSMAKPPLPRFPSDGVQRGSLFAIYDLGIHGVPEPRFAG